MLFLVSLNIFPWVIISNQGSKEYSVISIWLYHYQCLLLLFPIFHFCFASLVTKVSTLTRLVNSRDVRSESYWNPVQSSGAGYLDTMAGLVYAYWRMFQDKTLWTLSFERDYKSFFPIAVMQKEPEPKRLPIAQWVGRPILIRNEELIPTDAVLIKRSGANRLCLCNRWIHSGGTKTGNWFMRVEKQKEQSLNWKLWKRFHRVIWLNFGIKMPIFRSMKMENFSNWWIKSAITSHLLL